MNGQDDAPLGRLERVDQLRVVAQQRRAQVAFAAQERRARQSNRRACAMASGAVLAATLFVASMVETDGFLRWPRWLPGSAIPTEIALGPGEMRTFTVSPDGALTIVTPAPREEWFDPRYRKTWRGMEGASPPRSLLGDRWYYDRDLMGRRI